jgi:hypothetical protein
MQSITLHAHVGSDGVLQLQVPDDLRGQDVRITIQPVLTLLEAMDLASSTSAARTYDFADLIGKLQWQGNAIAMQRALRDE